MKNAIVEALCKEIRMQYTYLDTKALQTIYFGGGTPSLLDERELNQIFETIAEYFNVDADAEITLEANPDDLNIRKLNELKKTGINRLSIGIQSFNNQHLQYLHRIHSASEAETCVKQAQEIGINNISIDLIYGIPALGHAIWEADLAKVMALKVPHVSAYCLTIEPQTVFGNWLKKKKIQAIDEEFAAQQFEILFSHLFRNGYEQYEISNFAQCGQYSRHNSSYWKQHHYLGIGPSAHSFNGSTRQFNVSNNAHYLKAIQAGKIPYEIEQLTAKDKINEYLLTSLRTMWGCDLGGLEQGARGEGRGEEWGNYYLLIQLQIRSFIEKGWLWQEGSVIRLTQSGKLFADKIASDLFWIE